jgi:hypothetical protein
MVVYFHLYVVVMDFAMQLKIQIIVLKIVELYVLLIALIKPVGIMVVGEVVEIVKMEKLVIQRDSVFALGLRECLIYVKETQMKIFLLY